MLRSAGGSAFDPASPGAIGGTTPAAGTFTTLRGSPIQATADGTTTTVAFGRSTSVNTGIYFPGTNQVGIVANGTVAATYSSASVDFPLSIILNAAAATVGASKIGLGGTTATTVGAAGAASALPATPTGYWIINVAGTAKKVPYYDN